MAASSLMVPLGSQAPDFTLPDTTGTMIGRDDFSAVPALLVAFLCNHCPSVCHVETVLGTLLSHYPELAVMGICTNDADAYPGDRAAGACRAGPPRRLEFPYLVDADQRADRAYHAACTPDFFLFDGNLKLVYRGQFDASRPGSGIPVTGQDLRAAMDAVIAGKPVAKEQKPSIGCNIKWKGGY